MPVKQSASQVTLWLQGMLRPGTSRIKAPEQPCDWGQKNNFERWANIAPGIPHKYTAEDEFLSRSPYQETGCAGFANNSDGGQ